MFSNIKLKIALGLFIIFFFTIVTYFISSEEWGVEEFSVYERLIYCCNIQVGTFGYLDNKIFPITNNAKIILLIQRITSYVFRIILLI